MHFQARYTDFANEAVDFPATHWGVDRKPLQECEKYLSFASHVCRTWFAAGELLAQTVGNCPKQQPEALTGQWGRSRQLFGALALVQKPHEKNLTLASLGLRFFEFSLISTVFSSINREKLRKQLNTPENKPSCPLERSNQPPELSFANIRNSQFCIFRPFIFLHKNLPTSSAPNMEII